MDEPHTEYVGREAKAVTWEKAPAHAIKNYAMTAGILIDKLRLEEGWVTAGPSGLTLSQPRSSISWRHGGRNRPPPKTTL